MANKFCVLTLEVGMLEETAISLKYERKREKLSHLPFGYAGWIWLCNHHHRTIKIWSYKDINGAVRTNTATSMISYDVIHSQSEVMPNNRAHPRQRGMFTHANLRSQQ
uniref:Uncharacterized protein n=1 Tax=Tetraselmis sp. GSL018 TaxID=582737 RepID=A0A061QVE4_9CHLO